MWNHVYILLTNPGDQTVCVSTLKIIHELFQLFPISLWKTNVYESLNKNPVVWVVFHDDLKAVLSDEEESKQMLVVWNHLRLRPFFGVGIHSSCSLGRS